MIFEPCNAWVMIRVDDESGVQKRNGIWVADGSDGSQFIKGIVRAVGPGLWSVDKIERIPVSVAIGDTVVFLNGGLEYRVDGLKYILTQETNIVGILRDVVDAG